MELKKRYGKAKRILSREAEEAAGAFENISAVYAKEMVKKFEDARVLLGEEEARCVANCNDGYDFLSCEYAVALKKIRLDEVSELGRLQDNDKKSASTFVGKKERLERYAAMEDSHILEEMERSLDEGEKKMGWETERLERLNGIIQSIVDKLKEEDDNDEAEFDRVSDISSASNTMGEEVGEGEGVKEKKKTSKSLGGRGIFTPIIKSENSRDALLEQEICWKFWWDNVFSCGDEYLDGVVDVGFSFVPGGGRICLCDDDRYRLLEFFRSAAAKESGNWEALRRAYKAFLGGVGRLEEGLREVAVSK